MCLEGEECGHQWTTQWLRVCINTPYLCETYIILEWKRSKERNVYISLTVKMESYCSITWCFSCSSIPWHLSMSVYETLAYSKVCAVVCLLYSLIHLSSVTIHQAFCWVLEWIPWTWQPLPSWCTLCSLYVVYLLWVCTAVCCPIDVLIVRTFRQYK